MYSHAEKQRYPHYSSQWEKNLNIPTNGQHEPHYPQQHPMSNAHSSIDKTKEPVYDSLPNQRNRFLLENRLPANQVPWIPEGYQAQRAAMQSSANMAGLGHLYDTRGGEKVPFLGSFFDRHTLRNEFERFILLKLAGQSAANANAVPKTDLHRYAHSMADSASAQAKANSASNQMASQTPSPNAPKVNAMSKAEEKDAVGEAKVRNEGKLKRNDFFDKYSDNENGKWNENDPRMDKSVDRKTFGAASQRDNRSDNRNDNRNDRDNRNENRNERWQGNNNSYRKNYNYNNRDRQNSGRDYNNRESNPRSGYVQRSGANGYQRREDGGRFPRGGRRGRGRGFSRGGRRPFERRDGVEKKNEGENYFNKDLPVVSSSGDEKSEMSEENAWGAPSKGKKDDIYFGDDGDKKSDKSDGSVNFGDDDEGEDKVSFGDEKKSPKENTKSPKEEKSEEQSVDFGD